MHSNDNSLLDFSNDISNGEFGDDGAFDRGASYHHSMPLQPVFDRRANLSTLGFCYGSGQGHHGYSNTGLGHSVAAAQPGFDRVPFNQEYTFLNSYQNPTSHTSSSFANPEPSSQASCYNSSPTRNLVDPALLSHPPSSKMLFDVGSIHGDANTDAYMPDMQIAMSKTFVAPPASPTVTRTRPRHMCPEPGCGQAFTRATDLRRHHRIHNGQRDFDCKFEGCDRGGSNGFLRRDHLVQHQRSIHRMLWEEWDDLLRIIGQP